MNSILTLNGVSGFFMSGDKPILFPLNKEDLGKAELDITRNLGKDLTKMVLIELEMGMFAGVSGGIESNENPQESFFREAAEEVGIQIRDLRGVIFDGAHAFCTKTLQRRNGGLTVVSGLNYILQASGQLTDKLIAQGGKVLDLDEFYETPLRPYMALHKEHVKKVLVYSGR